MDGFFSVHHLEMYFALLCFMSSMNTFVKICVLMVCTICVVCFFFIIFKVLVQLRSGLLQEVINTLEAAVEVDTPPFVKRTEFSEQVVSIQWWENVHGSGLSRGNSGSPTELQVPEFALPQLFGFWCIPMPKAAGWLLLLLDKILSCLAHFLLWILLLEAHISSECRWHFP